MDRADDVSAQAAGYHIAAVRDLLRDAFTPDELRRFCLYHPPLQFLVSRFGSGASLEDMIEVVVVQCLKRELISELLAAVAQFNPGQFERYRPRLYVASSDAPESDQARAAVSPVAPGTGRPAGTLARLAGGLGRELPRGRPLFIMILLAAAVALGVSWALWPEATPETGVEIPRPATLTTEPVKPATGASQEPGIEPSAQLVQSTETEEPDVHLSPEPESPSAWELIQSGEAYAGQGQYEQAAAEYEKALSLEPGRADVTERLGAVYMQLGRIEEAYQTLTQTVDAAPTRANAYFDLGVACVKLDRRREEAIKNFEAFRVHDEGLNEERNDLALEYLDRLTNFPTPADLTRVVVADEHAFVMDRGTSKVFYRRIDPGQELLEPIELDRVLVRKGERVGEVRLGYLMDMAWMPAGLDRAAAGLVILESDGNLVEYDPALDRFTVVSVAGAATWQSPRLVGGYDGRLYVLDARANQIWRYRATAEGYTSEPGGVLLTAEDLSDAVDMVVGDSIYLLLSRGRIYKLTGGQRDEFDASEWAAVLKTPSALFAGPPGYLSWLYIADPGNGFIVACQPDGAFEAVFQLTEDQVAQAGNVLTDVSSLFVDEVVGRAYFVSQGRLYAMAMEPGTATVTHVVRPGDTLANVARVYRTSVHEILRLNGLANPNYMYAGQRLRIPIGGPSQTAQVVISQTVEAGSLPGEGVVLANSGDRYADLEGWSLSDEDGNSYVLPRFVLWQTGRVVVHTGAGRDGAQPGGFYHLYWGQAEPVWSVGEVATLRDANGQVMATLTVGP